MPAMVSESSPNRTSDTWVCEASMRLPVLVASVVNSASR